MWRALFLVTLVAACDSGQLCPATPGGCDVDRDAFVDGPTIDAVWPPNAAFPGGQQGCQPGQKYTWFHVQEVPERIGKIGCAPDGTVPEGGSCTFGPTGETTGYDNCVAGFVCSEGICADICYPTAAAGTPSACATGTCTLDPMLFANGTDDPVYGVCR